jgi:hypothetical protein
MLATLPVGMRFIPDRSQVLGSDAGHAASGTELSLLSQKCLNIKWRLVTCKITQFLS